MSCELCEKKTNRTSLEKRNLEVRINKIIGQLNGIKQMITDDRYCSDILIQLSATEKSIKSLSSVILDNHLNSCIKRSIENGNTEVVDEIIDLFKRYM